MIFVCYTNMYAMRLLRVCGVHAGQSSKSFLDLEEMDPKNEEKRNCENTEQLQRNRKRMDKDEKDSGFDQSGGYELSLIHISEPTRH